MELALSSFVLFLLFVASHGKVTVLEIDQGDLTLQAKLIYIEAIIVMILE